MARTFVKSDPDFIHLTLPSLTSTLSISLWYYLNSSPGASSPNRMSFVTRGNSTVADVNYGLSINSSGIFTYSTTAPSTYFGNTTNAGNITGTWQQVVWVTDFTALGAILYLGGASQGFNAYGTAGTPENVGGADAFGTQSDHVSDPLDGRMADIGIWSVKLTQGEATSLSQGARAYTIRPASIVGYWPLDGIASPEPDLSGNAANGTLTGTSLAPGPPFMPFTPRTNGFAGWTPLIGAAGIGWIIKRRNRLMKPVRCGLILPKK